MLACWMIMSRMSSSRSHDLVEAEAALVAGVVAVVAALAVVECLADDVVGAKFQFHELLFAWGCIRFCS